MTPKNSIFAIYPVCVMRCIPCAYVRAMHHAQMYNSVIQSTADSRNRRESGTGKASPNTPHSAHVSDNNSRPDGRKDGRTATAAQRRPETPRRQQPPPVLALLHGIRTPRTARPDGNSRRPERRHGDGGLFQTGVRNSGQTGGMHFSPICHKPKI